MVPNCAKHHIVIVSKVKLTFQQAISKNESNVEKETRIMIWHESWPSPSSIPSNTAEDVKVAVRKSLTKQKEVSHFKNNYQGSTSKLAFVIGDSFVKDVDGYIIAGSLGKICSTS